MPVSLASSSAASMHGALVPITSAIAGAPSTNVNFTNIPQTYQDLRIVLSIQNTAVIYDLFFALNGDFTGNSASRTLLSGDGSSASSSRRSNDSVIYMPMSSSSTAFTSFTIDVLNYTSTTQKTVLWRSAQDLNGSGTTILGVARKNTGAVTSLEINPNGGSFSTGSIFSIYGIRSVGQ